MRRDAKFPIRIQHRKHEAVIYGQTEFYRFYRVTAKAEAKRWFDSRPSPEGEVGRLGAVTEGKTVQ